MKLNIYKNQKEIERTVETDEYDIMYGTIEDILSLVDSLGDTADDTALLKLATENLPMINDLLKDIFYEDELTDEDLRKVKLKELVPLFKDVISYVKKSFGKNEKN